MLPPNSTPARDVQGEEGDAATLTEAQRAIIAQRQQHLHLSAQTPVVPAPATGAELAELRQSLTRQARDAHVPGMGAFGSVFGLRLEVRWQEIAPNTLNPREGLWDDGVIDEDMQRLCQSLLGPHGQISDIIVTPLWPDDARVADGYRWVVVKGSRLLRAFSIVRRKNPVRITEVLRRDGQPLTRYEQLAYYSIAHFARKPLTLAEVVRHLANVMYVFEEDTAGAGQEARLVLPDAETLQQHWGLSRSSAYRALQVVREAPRDVIHGIVKRTIPAHAVLSSLNILPDPQDRNIHFSGVLAENAQRAAAGQEPLTGDDLVARAEALQRTPRTPRQALPSRPTALPEEQVVDSTFDAAAAASVRAQWASRVLSTISAYEKMPDLAREGIPAPVRRMFERMTDPAFQTRLRALLS